MADLSFVEEMKSIHPTDIISVRENVPGEAEFTVKASGILGFLNTLKNLRGGGFEHLSDMTGFDRSPKTPRFGVVYNLTSMARKVRCSVVVEIDENNPTIESITGLWAGANWLERETYDMLGIRFIGHPDLRRILMPDVFQGHPLRKDFVIDYRQEFPKNTGRSAVFDPTGNTIIADHQLGKGSST